MGMLNSITEQLKSKESRLVMGVTMAARSQAHRTWKGVDLRLTDAVNEAKDNVKYLTTLEKSLEPMYIGTRPQVIRRVAFAHQQHQDDVRHRQVLRHQRADDQALLQDHQSDGDPV